MIAAPGDGRFDVGSSERVAPRGLPRDGLCPFNGTTFYAQGGAVKVVAVDLRRRRGARRWTVADLAAALEPLAPRASGAEPGSLRPGCPPPDAASPAAVMRWRAPRAGRGRPWA